MKSPVPPEVLALLGNPDPERVSCELHDLPPSAFAQARSAPTRRGRLANADPWIDLGDLGQRSELSATTTRFYDPPGIQLLRGAGVTDEHFLTIDTTSGPALMVLRDGRVILVTENEVRAYKIPTPDERRAESPPGDPKLWLAGADPRRWCADAGAPAWLVRAVNDLLNEPSTLSTLAAMGLLVRLWTPGDAAQADNPQPPLQRLIRWLPTLTDSQRDTIERSAVERASGLAARFQALQPDDGTDTRELVHDRDDLQSILCVLLAAGRGRDLATALTSVDDAASRNASVLAGQLPDVTEDEDAERWMAVAWQEPEAWWPGDP